MNNLLNVNWNNDGNPNIANNPVAGRNLEAAVHRNEATVNKPI